MAIDFISIAYTTTMHTHTSFSIYVRWSTILSILHLSTTTSGIAWRIVGGKGTTRLKGGICSIMSSHWKNRQPPAWNTRLTTHSLTLNHAETKNACMWKDAYQKVGALVEDVVQVLLCGCSVPVGKDMAIRAIHPPCVWDSHCSVVWALRHGCCLRGDRGRKKKTEWMATFVWHPAKKFGGKNGAKTKQVAPGGRWCHQARYY
jgi:hypothetical protein